MSQGALPVAIGVAALLLGLAIGWLVARSAPGPGPGPSPRIGDRHVVVVGPTAADVHPPKTRLSKQRREQIFWITAGPGHDLVIESEQRLFEQQTLQANQRWAMTCSGRTCSSNAILGSVQHGPTEYKYWQIFRQNGQTVDEADGLIIIDR